MGLRSGAPSLGVAVSDNKKLIGVEEVIGLGAGRWSIWIEDVRERCSGRTIFLVIKTILFCCWHKRERSNDRHGLRMRRRWGRRGYWWRARCWRLYMVGWGVYFTSLSSLSFLYARVVSVKCIKIIHWRKGKGRRRASKGQPKKIILKGELGGASEVI